MGMTRVISLHPFLLSLSAALACLPLGAVVANPHGTPTEIEPRQRIGQEDEEPPAIEEEITLAGGQLTLSLKGLSGAKLVQGPSDGQLQGVWEGRIGQTKLSLALFFYDRERFGFREPHDVLRIAEFNLPAPKGSKRKRNGQSSFASEEFREGPYGYIPVAWMGIYAPMDGTREVNHELHLTGLTETNAYNLKVKTDPALVEADRQAILDYVWSAMRYKGAVRDANWTDMEADDRWERDTPDKVFEDGRFVKRRTKYYLILTNLGKSTTKAFAGKMDANYEAIRKVYPFEDMPAQRLLPIFYFVQKEQYHDWCEKVIGNRMSTSAGVATGDVYATYHQAIGAPVHIHEATHQIFSNRLFLGGGGSWFQEGVAEYMSAKPGELSTVKNLVKSGKYKKFHEFFALKSLLGDADTERVTGGSDAGESYAHAAAIIEFVRHSKFGKKKFLEFVHTVGKVPRGNLKRIEAALQKVYEVDISGFEEEFEKYWKARRSRKKI